MAGIIQLLISDITMSFMWVWSSVLIKIFVHNVLGYRYYDLHGEIIRYSLSIMNMFLFAYLAKLTKGGAYNPLTVLTSAISGSFGKFLFTLGSRIPLQDYSLSVQLGWDFCSTTALNVNWKLILIQIYV
ncbi:probable aquaporin SIP2-1 [Tanacetum coccineum]